MTAAGDPKRRAALLAAKLRRLNVTDRVHDDMQRAANDSMDAHVGSDCVAEKLKLRHATSASKSVWAEQDFVAGLLQDARAEVLAARQQPSRVRPASRGIERSR
ncbi:hypothetical protein [Nocardia brasiliensis]|uniref:hypothetical protein n=1 Tax=Nocardia brasiliensis TaxID=37326 RepID=UPI002453BCE7|nr:hypothetical protein [Nocardia brasiliensis]